MARSRMGTSAEDPGRARLPGAARAFRLALSGLFLAAPGSAGAQEPARAAGPSAPTLEQRIERLVRHELRQKDIPAMALVAVADGRVVLARGYDRATDDGEPRGAGTTSDTRFRVGSVSKLFTDLALMTLVEAGRVDLDRPVSEYLPTFRPENPFGIEITPRMLTCHRSGLVREPPVGNYFDASRPDLASTVESLNRTRLVHAPGSTTAYSNAGLAVVGRLVEEVSGEPFAAYVDRVVLTPLGMTRSSFEPAALAGDDLAPATMWSEDGRGFPAPRFPLGMAPAGDLVSTAADLGRFLVALGHAAAPVVSPVSFAEMTRVQLASEGAETGFGIGFRVGSNGGHRTVGHGGAVYGYSTELVFLPDDGVGCAVLSPVDLTNSVTGRIGRQVIRWLLAARTGASLDAVTAPRTAAIDPRVARALDGAYATADGAGLRLEERDGRLFARLDRAHVVVRAEVRAAGDAFRLDDRHADGPEFQVDGGGRVILGERVYSRVADPRPAPCPDALRERLGEYGEDHNVLFVYERGGELHALVEWFEHDRLWPTDDPDTFSIRGGMYGGETLDFTRDDAGRITGLVLSGVSFRRRALEGEGRDFFSITPQRPVDALALDALSATPPDEPAPEDGGFLPDHLVEVVALDDTIRTDIRYATERNFMRTRFYSEPRAFLQLPAAAAVARAHAALERDGLGLLLHDGYRPWYVTKMFFDATPEEDRDFVADPAKGSRHNRGCAIDLTLFDRETGEVLDLGGLYDEMTERSYPDYPVATDRQRWYRERLRRAMEAEGFSVYPYEWWHFDYAGWRRYRIGNARFEKL